MMSLFLIVLVLLICSQFHLSEMAVGRALVKAGDDFTFDSVPGQLLVKRTTKAHADPQYLWAGAGQQCGATSAGGWTTDGKNQIGNATLEWESGKMVIKNFTAEDAGGYTFPLEGPHPNLAPTLLVMELDES